MNAPSIHIQVTTSTVITLKIDIQEYDDRVRLNLYLIQGVIRARIVKDVRNRQEAIIFLERLRQQLIQERDAALQELKQWGSGL